MKVAVIGLPPLYAYGLRALIGERWPEHDVVICDIDSHVWRGADCHIVSAAALASLARFLMSELDRVMLITSSSPSANTLMPMLSPNASVKDVYHALDRMFACVSDKKASPPATHMPLTQRESEILRLIAAGRTSRQIADMLCISQNTVLTHRKNIAVKTGLHTVSALTHFAMVHGLMR